MDRERSNLELGRDVDRIAGALRDHAATHVSTDAFKALSDKVSDIESGIQRMVWLLVGQLIVISGGAILLFIAKAIGGP